MIIAQLTNHYLKKMFCTHTKNRIRCVKALNLMLFCIWMGARTIFDCLYSKKNTLNALNLIQTTFGGGLTCDVQWRHSYRWNLILMSSETQ